VGIPTVKFFLDSAKLDEIEIAYESFGIDGVTTNPRHVQASGKTFAAVCEDLAAWVEEKDIAGAERFPISVEVDPHIQAAERMMDEARRLAAICPNFVIKIPCTLAGIKASRRLEREGIRTNVTLVFTPSQALVAGKNRAKFVSPFIGWKEASGEDGLDLIASIVQIYSNFDFDCEIICAAVRTGKQIADCARAGAHIVTAGLAVYQDSFAHPFTDKGLGIFAESWDKTAKE
jgi:transaldolase